MAIPIEEKFVPCRHDDGTHAVGRYKTPEGCICFPNDREQDLCGQHVMRDGMNGDNVELILVYDVGFYKMFLGERRFNEDMLPYLAKNASEA